MEEDKDDSNDSQDGDDVYRTMTRVSQRKSAWKGLFPPRERRYACAVRIMSVRLDSESRTVLRRHLANAKEPGA